MNDLLRCSVPHEKQQIPIVAGNDFSINVVITERNSETGDWDRYVLTAEMNPLMFLVSSNGKRINTKATIESDGSLTAQIPGYYLSKSMYGIEITFISEGRNHRTYAPDLIKIVTATETANEGIRTYNTTDPYRFNLKLEADIAFLNIGSLPSDYITEDDLSYVLTSYVTNDELDNTLSSYITNDELDSTLSSYVTNDELDDTLSAYITNDELDSTLSSYVTNNSLNNTLSSYVKQTTLDTTLASYVQQSSLSTQLLSYFNNAQYDSYNMQINMMHDDNVLVSIDASDFVISGMIDSVYVQNGYLYIEFITSTGTETVSIAISDIVDVQNYYTKSEIDNTLSSYATQSYVTDAIAAIDIPDPDLSSYVTLDTVQSIEASKTFSYSTTINNAEKDIYYQDIYPGKYKTSAARLSTNQLLTGQIYAPSTDKTDSSWTLNNIKDEITIYTSPILNLNDPQKEIGLANQMMKITPNGIYEGSTLLADKYVSYDYLSSQSYATESYVNDAVSSIDLSYYYTKTDIDTQAQVTTYALTDLNDRVTYIEDNSSIDLSSYVTYDYLDAQSYITINDIPEVDLSSYVTYDYLNAQSYITINDIPEVDLSSYVKQTTLDTTLASYVTYTYWDSSNEAIAYEFVNNRNEHNAINAQFGYYYTKTEADSRYATQNWANNKFVTSYDNERQNEAIAYAISYLNDNIGQGGEMPDLSSYVTYDYLSAQSYLTQTDLSSNSYVTQQSLSNNSYVTQQSLSNNSYVTSNALMATLAAADYVTHYYLDNASYATESYVANAIANIPTGGEVSYAYLNTYFYDKSEIDSQQLAVSYALDSIMNTYVTSSYISNIWKGSQTDYNNILVKDPNTLYIII